MTLCQSGSTSRNSPLPLAHMWAITPGAWSRYKTAQPEVTRFQSHNMVLDYALYSTIGNCDSTFMQYFNRDFIVARVWSSNNSFHCLALDLA